jgi:hypothetical protein
VEVVIKGLEHVGTHSVQTHNTTPPLINVFSAIEHAGTHSVQTHNTTPPLINVFSAIEHVGTHSVQTHIIGTPCVHQYTLREERFSVLPPPVQGLGLEFRFRV